MNNNNNNNFVITIGRQMGSGGRELGKLLAEKLNVDFYDKRLLLDAAKKSGLLPEIFERDDERTPSMLSGAIGIGMSLFGAGTIGGYVGDDMVYRAQSDMIRELGATKSCIIVGRTADYVLRDHPRCISIFVHAPEEACIKRIIGRGDKDCDDKAKALCRKINKLRASYYNFYTDRTWGAASTYDLTINSSLLPMEQIAELVASYIRSRLAIWQKFD